MSYRSRSSRPGPVATSTSSQFDKVGPQRPAARLDGNRRLPTGADSRQALRTVRMPPSPAQQGAAQSRGSIPRQARRARHGLRGQPPDTQARSRPPRRLLEFVDKRWTFAEHDGINARRQIRIFACFVIICTAATWGFVIALAVLIIVVLQVQTTLSGSLSPVIAATIVTTCLSGTAAATRKMLRLLRRRR